MGKARNLAESENTCVRVFFLIQLQAEVCKFIKKKTLVQVFSCELCEISKNIFFTEHLRMTAFGYIWNDLSLQKMRSWICSIHLISIRISDIYENSLQEIDMLELTLHNSVNIISRLFRLFQSKHFLSRPIMVAKFLLINCYPLRTQEFVSISTGLVRAQTVLS